MSAAPLLERLQRVHQSAPDRWRAICPAHESRHRTQSLAIRELADGTVLLKCFAGCGVSDILEKLDLEMSILFPAEHRAPQDARRPQRPNQWHAMREAVKTLQHECIVVAITADDIAANRPLSPADAERCATAAGRIRAAVEACS